MVDVSYVWTGVPVIRRVLLEDMLARARIALISGRAQFVSAMFQPAP